MSMMRCDRCDRLIDTDDDVECWQENDECWCENCRINRWINGPDDEKLDDPRHEPYSNLKR